MRRLIAIVPPLLLLILLAGSVPGMVMHLLDTLFIPYIAGFTLLGVAVLWMLAPIIIDTLLQSGYSLDWRELDALPEETATFLRECAEGQDMAAPRIGVIPADTPWLFSYGAGRWNARIIITRGLLDATDPGQQQALLAREIGHIVRPDLGLVTVMQALYHLLYTVTGHDPERGGAADILLFPVILPFRVVQGIVRFTVLPLSWFRTYDADRFAANHAETTSVVTGLTTLSRGILACRDHRLIDMVAPVAPQSLLLGRRIGLGAINRETEDILETVLRYDIHSPWTVLTLFRAMQPPTGKRLVRLPGIKASPAIDYAAITAPITTGTNHPRFSRVLFVHLLPLLSLVGYPLIYLGVATMTPIVLHLPTFLGGWLAVIGAALTVRTIERYPPITPEPLTVAGTLQRILQPRPTRPVRIDGTLTPDADIGVPADAVLQDETGRIPVNYRSSLPLLGSFLGQHRLREQFDEDAMVTGWLMHDAWPRLDLRHAETRTDTVRGAVRIGALLTGLLLAVAGAGVITVL